MGSPNGCCCGHCRHIVKCHECCLCLPLALCVNVISTTEACPCATCDIGRFDCVGGGRYEGEFECGAMTVDLAFTIEKAEDDLCYLYLESECLGLTGNNRPAQLLSECLDGNCENFDFEFLVTGAGACGNMDCDSLTIKVRDARIVRNISTEDCDGCANCLCLPRYFCVRFFGGGCTFLGQVEYDDDLEIWQGDFTLKDATISDPDNLCFASSLTVKLVPEVDLETGKCGLHVYLEGGLELDLGVHVIADLTCPFGVAIAISPDPPPDPDFSSLTINASACGGCLECCCFLQPPETLFAELQGLPANPACRCWDGVLVELTFNGVHWEGSASVCSDEEEGTGSGGSGTPDTVHLIFECDPVNGETYNLWVKAGCTGNGWEQFAGTNGADPSTEICEPFEWEASSTVGSCCLASVLITE